MITAVLSAVCFVGFVVIKQLEKADIYIYYMGVDSDELIFSLQISFAILLAITIIPLMFLNIKYKWMPSVMTVVIIFEVLVFMAVASLSNSADEKYYEFTSDDGQHQIIVCEWSWLLGGSGRFYERTSFCTMKSLGGYSTDDGYHPISQNQYRFEWYDDGFDFYYSYRGSDDEPYRVESIEYID